MINKQIVKKFYKVAKSGIGKTNPELINNNFFEYMIKTGIEKDKYEFYDLNTFSAFDVRKILEIDEIYEKIQEPIWCNQRFGRTKTKLKDGSIIYIGGEHEDSYDPDFYVYNDVILIDKNNNIKLFCYPKDVFPPTDFHIAVLYNEYIYITRNAEHLHYNNHKFYKLNIKNFKIIKIGKDDIPTSIYGKYKLEKQRIREIK
jgi:hypothetical protein